MHRCLMDWVRLLLPVHHVGGGKAALATNTKQINHKPLRGNKQENNGSKIYVKMVINSHCSILVSWISP